MRLVSSVTRAHVCRDCISRFSVWPEVCASRSIVVQINVQMWTASKSQLKHIRPFNTSSAASETSIGRQSVSWVVPVGTVLAINLSRVQTSNWKQIQSCIDWSIGWIILIQSIMCRSQSVAVGHIMLEWVNRTTEMTAFTAQFYVWFSSVYVELYWWWTNSIPVTQALRINWISRHHAEDVNWCCFSTTLTALSILMHAKSRCLIRRTIQ